MKKRYNIFNCEKSKLNIKNNNQNLFIGPWLQGETNLFKEKFKNFPLLNDYNKIKKYKDDTKYLKNIYSILLKLLGNKLNKIHNIKFKTKEWEIILSRWLMTWITHNFFLWVYLEKVINSINIKKFYCLKFKETDFIPIDSWDSHTYCRISSNWSDYTFQKILNFRYKNKFKIIFLKKYKKKKKKESYLSLNGFFYKKKEKVFLYKFDTTKKIKLYIKKEYKNYGFNFIKNKEIKTNYFDRENIRFQIETKDLFLNFLVKNLNNNLPKSYLENFNQIKNKINKSNLPENINYIFTSYGQYYDEFFKIYIALVKNKYPQTKLCILQHGYGGIFTADNFYNIYLDQKISDIYLTWGIYKRKSDILFGLPSGKYKNKKFKSNNINYFKSKKILIISYSWNYTLTQPIEGSINGIYKDYIILQKIGVFFENINQNLLEKIEVKTQCVGEINSFDYSIKKKFKKIQFLKSSKNFLNIHQNYNFVIHTFIGTPFFESIALNIPFILIYDEKSHLPFNENFKKIIIKLKKNNILFENPNEAAKFVVKNYDRIKEWWNLDSIQQLIKEIADKYCLVKKEENYNFKKIIG